jgi:tetratricopeptide (TPR) repeat protein
MSQGFLFIRVNPLDGEPSLEIGAAETRPKRVRGDRAPRDVPYVVFDAAVPDREQAEAVVHSALAAYAGDPPDGRYRLPAETAVPLVRGVAEQLQRVAVYRRAVAAEPENAAAHNNLGVGLDRIGDHAGAIDAFKRAIELEGNNAVFFANLGCNYGKLRLYRKAIEAFRSAIELRPDFLKAHFDLGFSYGRLGRHKKAVETFQRAIAINPNVAQLHFHLGHAFARLGRHREAVKSLGAAIRINPNHASAHFRLGLAHLRAHNRDGALEEYRILRTLDETKARRLFRGIYRRYGQGAPAARTAASL